MAPLGVCVLWEKGGSRGNGGAELGGFHAKASGPVQGGVRGVDTFPFNYSATSTNISNPGGSWVSLRLNTHSRIHSYMHINWLCLYLQQIMKGVYFWRLKSVVAMSQESTGFKCDEYLFSAASTPSPVLLSTAQLKDRGRDCRFFLGRSWKSHIVWHWVSHWFCWRILAHFSVNICSLLGLIHSRALDKFVWVSLYKKLNSLVSIQFILQQNILKFSPNPWNPVCLQCECISAMLRKV